MSVPAQWDEQDWIDLGDDHHFVWLDGSTATHEERFPETTHPSAGDGRPVTRCGIIVDHRNPNTGERCAGAVMFAKVLNPSEHEAKRPIWECVNLDPLHLEPSILCSCGDHGYVRDGRWQRA